MTRIATAAACPAPVSTPPDPAARLLAALDDRGDCLRRYAAAYVAATTATDRRLLGALRARGATIVPQPPGVPGVAQRAALAAAVAAGHSSFLSCDFDRWLHWVGRFPEELAALPG